MRSSVGVGACASSELVANGRGPFGHVTLCLGREISAYVETHSHFSPCGMDRRCR